MANTRYNDCMQCGWSNVVDKDSGVCIRCGDYPGKQAIKEKDDSLPHEEKKLCIICDMPSGDSLYCPSCIEEADCFSCGYSYCIEDLYKQYDAYICERCLEDNKPIENICCNCGDENISGLVVSGQDLICQTCLEEEEDMAESKVTGLPTDAKARKNIPIATGVIDYFPDALACIAEVSKVGNDQHNPGKPLHWDKTKSTDHADSLVRHLIQRGTFDTDGMRHSAKVAWRALALLQIEIENHRS